VEEGYRSAISADVVVHDTPIVAGRVRHRKHSRRALSKGTNAHVTRDNRTGRGGDAVSCDPNFHEIGKPDQIDRLIAQCSTLGLPGGVELLRAVRDGAINLVEIERQAAAPMRAIENSPRPVVMLLGDDDYRSTGPSGWAAWQRLSYWARDAMVYATGADVPSYRLAIGLALIQQRFLLIETDSAHAHDWGAALHRRNVPTLGLMPPSGVHPVMPARDAVQ
jgi:hypothetical protein